MNYKSAISAYHKAVSSNSRRASLAATIHHHRTDRNWWHDISRPVSREDVRSQFNTGRWGNSRMFAQVPASRYND